MLSETQNRALLKALAKDPAERFENCMALIDALAVAEAGVREDSEIAEPQTLSSKDAVSSPTVTPETQPKKPEEQKQTESSFASIPAPLPESDAGKIRIGGPGKIAIAVLLLLTAVLTYTYVMHPEWAWMITQPIGLGEKTTMRSRVDEHWYIAYGASLMSFAAVKGRVNVLEWLKSNGEDVNAKDRSGETPMHHAAYGGHVAAMEWLKKNGADVNAKANNGNTPLYYATAAGRTVAVDWLKANGGK